MSATLRGYSRSDEEGHVLTDRAELAAAFDYQQSPTYELLDTGVFAYLWNLPCPEHDDRRWAGYTFYDPVLLDEHGFGSSDPLNPFPIPTGAQGVGRDFATEGRECASGRSSSRCAGASPSCRRASMTSSSPPGREPRQ